MSEQDNPEIRKRYEAARCLLDRCRRSYERKHYSPGETIEEVMDDVQEFLSNEVLEEELFGIPIILVKRATGRMIPDLTGVEHVCQYQARMRTAK